MATKVLSEWKKANVSSILKKGRKKDPGNYLTSSSSNVMQQILLEDVSKHKENSFTTGKSCLINLVIFCDRVME